MENNTYLVQDRSAGRKTQLLARVYETPDLRRCFFRVFVSVNDKSSCKLILQAILGSYCGIKFFPRHFFANLHNEQKMLFSATI